MASILGLASTDGRMLRRIHRERPGGAGIDVIISDDPDAPVLGAAENLEIPTEVIELDPVDASTSIDRAIRDVVAEYNIDLVCLDEYVGTIPQELLAAMPPIFDVHYSLLPSFPGSDPVSAALESGVSITGSTVYLVVDQGGVARDVPIVTQEPVPVYQDDSTDRLQNRIRGDAAEPAYLRATRWFATDNIVLETAVDGQIDISIADDAESPLPQRRIASSDRIESLRYGENPHQAAALYRDRPAEEPSVVGATQVGGDRAMSYVNYVDAAGALDLVLEFDRPAAAVIKHANPAGCAVDEDLSVAYERALSTDPMSAFGGVVALNRPCDTDTARSIVSSVKHVIVAPGYGDEALDVLGQRESMRILDVSGGEPRPIGPDDRSIGLVERSVIGGRLVQDRDRHRLDAEECEVVTTREPTADERAAMMFAWPVVKHATSNAIALASGSETVGIGIGQVSRVDAVRIATLKADEHAEGKSADGAVLASDAFFPFPDGIELAAAAGVSAVIQPGGSMRDEEVIAAAEANDMAMIFTGIRSFRHK